MTNSTGRPRSEVAYKAILNAAFRLVTNRGFKAVTVNEIASEVGVGKITLYRHWPDKAAVFMNSLLALIGDETAFRKPRTHCKSTASVRPTGSLFSKLTWQSHPSLVAEAQSDPELALAFRERWLIPRREGVRQTMRRAMLEGFIRKYIDIDTAIDLLYGSLYYRLLLGAGPFDKKFIDGVYRQFLVGHGNSSQTALGETEFALIIEVTFYGSWLRSAQGPSGIFKLGVMTITGFRLGSL